MMMAAKGNIEIPRPQSIREIEQTDLGYLPIGALAIQRAQMAEYFDAVYELTGLDASDLHFMSSDVIALIITNAQGERAA